MGLNLTKSPAWILNAITIYIIFFRNASANLCIKINYYKKTYEFIQKIIA